MAISGAQYAKIKVLLYKCSLYAIILFLIAVAQVSFFTKINILGATPDLLLAAVVALCIKEEHKIASICGIISGFLYCSLGGIKYPIYILFSFLCAYTLKIIALRSLGTNYPSFLALSLLAFGIKVVFNLFDASMFSSNFVIFRILWQIALPELISSMIFCSISYLLISVISHLINKKSKSRKDEAQ